MGCPINVSRQRSNHHAKEITLDMEQMEEIKSLGIYVSKEGYS